MDDWKEFHISELAVSHSAARVPLSKMEREARRGGYPYYGASGVIDFVDDFLFDGEYVLISEDGENLKTRQTPIAFKAKGKFWVNNHAHVIQGHTEWLNDLLVYYFQNLDLSEYLTGAVQPKLNKANLESIKLWLPVDPDEQRAIASVLSSLDVKIDLLHRQNKTLEAMAETLFRQWFVEEAEEGWEEYVLTDVASHCKDSENPGQYPTRIYQHYSLPAYDQGRKPSPELGDTIKSSKYVVPENAVLVSKLNPRFPRVWPVRVKKHEHPISSTEFQVFVPKQAEMFGFLYCFLISKPVQDELASAASGTSGSHQRVSPDDIKGLSFQAKSKQQVIDFSKVVDPLLEKIETNKDQVANLTKLRDTLLPKLMSGEVRVEEFQFT